MADPVRKAVDEEKPGAAPFDSLSIARTLDEEQDALESGVPHMSTGFERLDQALGGGFTIPSLNIIGAGPKSLKSTWVEVVAEHVAQSGGLVFMLDLENGRRRSVRRAACRMAKLGPSRVKRAVELKGTTFDSGQDLERWRQAKADLRKRLGPSFFAEYRCPQDLRARISEARTKAGDRQLLVVIDSLQKLPVEWQDRRASTDKWLRAFEAWREEFNAVLLVVSEIKRDMKGGYTAHESSFKETGGIEYAADLAMTLSRTTVDEGDKDAVSTLRVELARDSEEDPRGDVASYRAVFPHYGLEEIDPVARKRKPGPTADKTSAAVDFLQDLLAPGPVKVAEVVSRGAADGHSRATLYRARDTLNVGECTLELKKAWRLP